MTNLNELGKRAKAASANLAKMTDKERARVLLKTAEILEERAGYLIEENARDIKAAREKGMSASFIDRLTLDEKVIRGMAEGIRQVASLESPVDKVVYKYDNEYQGIKIVKKTVPFGVIGIIYESRPNVTADAFALCYKSANAVVLRGGSESINSNAAIVGAIKQAIRAEGFDADAVSLIEDASRETAAAFMKLDKYIDLLIPRGGASLIRAAVSNSTVPIIETGTGNCHVYVDKEADAGMAAKIVFNAKTQRYSVCNALESLVVHSQISGRALPAIAEKLKEKKVEIRADERAYEVLKGYPYLAKATEEDFYTEYGDAIISVATVDDIDQAIAHINEHGTRHSEAIITSDEKAAEKFLREVDASSVYWNASTRFTDGFVFGLGAEIGISTQKLHARGPMGLDALVTTKYEIRGDGAVRK